MADRNPPPPETPLSEHGDLGITTLTDFLKMQQTLCPRCTNDECAATGLCTRKFSLICPKCHNQLSTMGESAPSFFEHGCPTCYNNLVIGKLQPLDEIIPQIREKLAKHVTVEQTPPSEILAFLTHSLAGIEDTLGKINVSIVTLNKSLHTLAKDLLAKLRGRY